MAKKTIEVEGENVVEPHQVLASSFDFSIKANLLALHKILMDLGIRSISDLENKIARAE